MRVVLTGGGGFIGSHVLARLIGAGHDVTLLGPHTGKSRYTASVVASGDARFVHCDARSDDDEVLRCALAGADVLMLLGCVMPTAEGVGERIGEEFARNVVPLVRVIQAARDHARHVVFASSASVYGVPARTPVRETEVPRPTAPYGIAKLACEHAIRVMCDAFGQSAALLRYSTVYGPGEVVPRAIPNFIRAALAGERPIVRGDGLDRHDYVHVSDAADATMAAIARRANGVYNVASGVGTTTVELAQLVFKLAGAAATPVFDLSAATARPRLDLVCDTEHSRGELGFTARRVLAESLPEEIGWFRSRLSTRTPPAGRRAA